MTAIQYDDGSGDYDEGYYVVVDEMELGPLTEEQVDELEQCLRAH